MRSGLKVNRSFGVNWYLHWSWLFIFFLIVLNLGTVFGIVHPEWNPFTVWSIAVIAALLFFISLLLHELAHSVVAKWMGVTVRNVTLFPFGGMSNVQREPTSPKSDFFIAIAGPIASFVIAYILGLLAGVTAGPIDTLTMTAPSEVVKQLSPVSTVFLWLGSINILLALFNLIPAFPLDGGRILRSIIWAITGSLRKATRWAAGVGQIIAWLLIFAGMLMAFGVQIPVLGTGFINGLWIAVIGLLLDSAAATSYEQVVIQDILQHVPVASVMRSNPPTVPPNISISSLVYDYVMKLDDYAFPVVDSGQLVGMVTMEDVRTVPREQWDTKTVRDIMTPVSELVVATPDEDAADALDALVKRDVRQLPVVREGHLAGLLRLRDIGKWLKLQSDVQMV